jgi:hypothetical protein
MGEIQGTLLVSGLILKDDTAGYSLLAKGPVEA